MIAAMGKRHLPAPAGQRRAAGSRHRTALARAALLALAFGLPLAAPAADPWSACAACHGAHGEGDARSGAPNIAGLDANYVERQLRNFASGRRGADDGDAYGARMRAAWLALGAEADPRRYAARVATLPAAPARGAVAGQRDAGRNYFNAVCSACHNSNGGGAPALSAPRLAGTDPAYLLRQLDAFRHGRRGSSADDTYGAQMRRMALNLPDEATVRDIVAYIASLPPPSKAGP